MSNTKLFLILTVVSILACGGLAEFNINAMAVAAGFLALLFGLCTVWTFNEAARARYR